MFTFQTAPWFLVACWMSAMVLTPARAGLPEPDAVVYGSVAVNGQPATAADKHLIIEARLDVAGPVIASTTMGVEPAAGHFYVLRIPVESGPPPLSPAVAMIGDTLLLRLMHAGSVIEESTVTLSGRAQAQRVDLGEAMPDSDGDTLPDAWELAAYGTLTYGPTSVALNGLSVRDNYIAGTDPNQPDSAFAVSIEASGGLVFVSFPTLSAQGPGYEGLTRYYTLQTAVDLNGGWMDVEGYVGVAPGTTQVVYPQVGAGQPGFYQVSVWLE